MVFTGRLSHFGVAAILNFLFIFIIIFMLLFWTKYENFNNYFLYYLLKNNNFQTISDEIAKDMKIKVSEVEKISERILKKDLLLDHSLNNTEDNRAPLDFLNDTSLNPDEITINNDISGNRKRVLKKSLEALNFNFYEIINS